MDTRLFRINFSNLFIKSISFLNKIKKVTINSLGQWIDQMKNNQKEKEKSKKKRLMYEGRSGQITANMNVYLKEQKV